MTASDLKFFRGKRIVVTGAAGFIGSCLVRRLRGAGCRIVRVLRTPAELPPGPGVARLEDVLGDVRERGVWKDALDGADVVFHLAAQTSAAAAEGDPEEDFGRNVLPMVRLLEECRRRSRLPAILFASTATIAGIPERLPVDEKSPDDPITVYDLHKKAAEDCLKRQVDLGAALGASLRLANVYGPGPSSGASDRGVLNRMIAQAIDGGTLTIYGKGEELRDYVYVEDVARAFLDAARRAERLNGRHFFIGSGRGRTVAQAVGLVAARVSAGTGRRVEVRRVRPPLPRPRIESRDFVADVRAFRKATGWRAEVPFVEGLDRTIRRLIRELDGRPAVV